MPASFVAKVRFDSQPVLQEVPVTMIPSGVKEPTSKTKPIGCHTMCSLLQILGIACLQDLPCGLTLIVVELAPVDATKRFATISTLFHRQALACFQVVPFESILCRRAFELVLVPEASVGSGTAPAIRNYSSCFIIPAAGRARPIRIAEPRTYFGSVTVWVSRVNVGFQIIGHVLAFACMAEGVAQYACSRRRDVNGVTACKVDLATRAEWHVVESIS